MKTLIATSIILLSSVTPVIAGEAYVRNVDSYSRETTRSRVNFYGRENYNGISREYSSANKREIERGRRGTTVYTSNVVSSELTRFNGYDGYNGVETGYGVTTEYSHEVAGGVR